MMVGRPVQLQVNKDEAHPGDVVLSVKNFTVPSHLHKKDAVHNVSFDVRAGEIVCIAGIDGNGQTEFIHGLTGLDKSSGGSITVCGHDISHYSIHHRGEYISHIPEDRHKHGLVLDFTLEQNLVLQRYKEPQFEKAGFIKRDAVRSYAQQLMDNYGDAYTANGIGLETLKLFQQLQYKHTLLLDLVYGKDGETPVEDGELTEHLDSTMYEIGFITVPLYNTSTFAFATDDQKAEMLSLAQKAADSYNAAAPEDTSSQLTAFNSIASSALTDICAVLDAEVPSTSTLQTDLLSESDLTDAFTQEGAADTLRGLAYGQAAAIQYTGYAMMLAVRLDPLGVSTLDALRSQILSDLKGEELDDALSAYGAQLDNSLSSSAMSKLPAAKIVNATSANS